MESLKDIISSGQLVLVDFFATWCGPCKSMHPILERLKEQMGDNLRILKIDVDKNQTIASQKGIQAVPTLMLFKNGQEVWRQSGAMPLANLASIVKTFI